MQRNNDLLNSQADLLLFMSKGKALYVSIVAIRYSSVLNSFIVTGTLYNNTMKSSKRSRERAAIDLSSRIT